MKINFKRILILFLIIIQVGLISAASDGKPSLKRAKPGLDSTLMHETPAQSLDSNDHAVINVATKLKAKSSVVISKEERYFERRQKKLLKQGIDVKVFNLEPLGADDHIEFSVDDKAIIKAPLDRLMQIQAYKKLPSEKKLEKRKKDLTRKSTPEAKEARLHKDREKFKDPEEKEFRNAAWRDWFANLSPEAKEARLHKNKVAKN